MKKVWLFPILLGILFLVAVIGSAHSVQEWMQPRWDGVHYLSIGERGFEISKCAPGGDPTRLIWCGNQWFPGWSYFNELIWRGLGLKALGLPLNTLYLVLAAVCLIALLSLLFRHSRLLFLNSAATGEAAARRIGAWACVGLLCQPGSFYFLTQFPYSFCLLTGLLFIVIRREPKALGIPERVAPAVAAGLGFWSGLSYPSGHFFFLYPFLDFLRGQDFRKPRGWVVLALWGAVFAGSTLLVCLIFQYKFGMFWLYFIHHAQNNDTRGNFFSLVNYLLRYGHENERLSFLWYAFGFILVSLRLPKPWREPSYWFVIVALAFTPATGRWVCLYRYDLMAMPLFALLGATECSAWLKLAYLGMGLYFQFGDLYPKYLSGNLM